MNIKSNILVYFLVLIISVILLVVSIIFFNSCINIKITDYNTLFEKGKNLIQNQDFFNALQTFELMYKKGYKTIPVIINCVYLYKLTNQIDKLYLFLKHSSIDIGYNPLYKKYILKILSSSDYKWFISLKLIDYLNAPIIFFSLLLSSILLVFFIFKIKNKNKLKNLFVIFLTLNIIICCLFFLKMNYYFHQDEAICIEQTEIYNFPLKDSSPIFSIKEYVNVKILRYYDDFVLVKLNNGKKGWIQKKSILKVFHDK